jgi:hypothetical protein
LEEQGILREVTGQALNRLYRADEILRNLESNEDHGRAISDQSPL